MPDNTPPKDSKSIPAKQDRDAIDRLSLENIPLASQALKNARLVKNVRMETAIELHNDPLTGSLQIKPEDIAQTFTTISAQDLKVITALSSLNSYDVYSLRSTLKKAGIAVDEKELELSAEMKAGLSVKVTSYTRPMLKKIFGNGSGVDMNDSEAFNKILRDPNVAKVRENLKIITQKTGIPLDEIPSFLESYGDVLMSVAYYHYSFEGLQKEMQRFQEWIKASQANKKDASVSPQAWARCRKCADMLRFLAISLHERMQILDKNFENFWKNINKDSFVSLRKEIEENHTSIGATICTLSVKLRAWSEAFPDNIVGGPIKRSTFVITEMEPGLERLMLVENEARRKSKLTPLA